MNKSKRARWCNPLEEGSTAEEVGGGGGGESRFWVLLGKGAAVGARGARARGRGLPSMYIFIQP